MIPFILISFVYVDDDLLFFLLSFIVVKINSFVRNRRSSTLTMTTAKYASLFPPVAPRWREILHIHVHGAANLPLIENQQPQSYVTA